MREAFFYDYLRTSGLKIEGCNWPEVYLATADVPRANHIMITEFFEGAISGFQAFGAFKYKMRPD